MENELKEYATKVLEKVKNSEYGMYIQRTTPAIHILTKEDIDKVKNGDIQDILRGWYNEGAKGLTVLEDMFTENMLAYKNESPHLRYRDIVLFVQEDFEEHKYSVLVHELMHSIFKGIPNEPDESHEFNEACTDYLAKEFYGESYFTTNEKIYKDSATYTTFFRDKNIRKKKLNEYFGSTNKS